MKKSVLRTISLVLAAAVLLSFCACGNSNGHSGNPTIILGLDEQTQETQTTQTTQTTVATTTAASTTTTTAASTTAPTTAAATVAATVSTIAASETATALTTVTTTAPPTTAATPESLAPKTEDEIIAYCNTALNKVKSEKPGMTKAYVMKVNGDVSGLPSSLTSLVNKNETKTYAKGSDLTDDFPAAGYDWSSKLTAADLSSYEFSVVDNFYIIKLHLGNEQNPAKGEASSYGKCMSVIDAAEAKNMLAAIKSVDMTYHDGYVYAKVDSTTGNVVECEFSATADVEASITLIGNISVKDIVSTETFTGFQW